MRNNITKASQEGKDFWKNYMDIWFGKNLIQKWEKLCFVDRIQSANGEISVEVYKNKDPYQPTIVFSHGIAGYARLLLPFIIPLYEKGYNIVAPDLEGFGFNNRKKGDFTFDIHLQNLNDAVAYARSQFLGPVFLGGASMGGPLAYATDARYDCADGLISWCLWDFSDREFIIDSSTTKGLTFFILPILRLTAQFLGRMTVKTIRFVPFRSLSKDPEFNDLLLRDPYSGNKISVRGAISLVTQSKPDIPHEKYLKPVLVCQPDDDEMTRPYHTKKVFNRLGSIQKMYVGFDGGHFPLSLSTYKKWGESVQNFIESLKTNDHSTINQED
ncbi:MAG: hypothetical protein CVU43_04435 [Chloroflexi bacterium HGW-Chloroflexi-5]|jgi:alpha-beta hydrolase superfamily lysophospholipase|nr:MAG: hypothetical protein CVU43_04435 [Chloroflexi bacterium HGW-Chloroflexi-5]